MPQPAPPVTEFTETDAIEAGELVTGAMDPEGNYSWGAETGNVSGGGIDPRKDRNHLLEKLRKELKAAGQSAALGELQMNTPDNKRDQRAWDALFSKIDDIVIAKLDSNDEHANIKKTVQDLKAKTETITAILSL